MPLRFGIPYLDDLIDVPFTVDRGRIDSEKKRAAAAPKAPAPESFTLIGPDGCGKSVLALHLASRYAADCYGRIRRSAWPAQPLPRIMYISSDFQFAGAHTVWHNFGLNSPNRRLIPF